MAISKNLYSFGLLPDDILYVKKMMDEEESKLKKLDLKSINQVDFPSNQYYQEQTKKKQIVLHHTVSGRGALGDINWWKQTKSRVATHVILDYTGKIYQCYSSKYWGHHLGVKKSNNKALNKASIGIEIDAWGGLVKYKKNWYPAKWDSELRRNVPNLNVSPITNVEEYPEGFRGFYGFEKYTDEQLISLEKLLIYWNSEYDIPIKYNEDIWDLNADALAGKPGVYTHVSYRTDKSDCHPQPELIQLLKSLK